MNKIRFISTKAMSAISSKLKSLEDKVQEQEIWMQHVQKEIEKNKTNTQVNVYTIGHD